MMKAKARYICWQEHSEIASEAREATVGIFMEKEKGYLQIGTGMLLRFNNNYYLVTAAHVMADCRKSGGKLCIGNRAIGLISLEEEIRGARPLGVGLEARTASWDVAAIRLLDATLDKIPSGAFWCCSQSLSPFDTRHECLLLGYPAGAGLVSGDKGLGNDPLKIEVSSYDGPTDSLRGYDEVLHLLFRFEKRGHPGLGGRKVMVGLPDGLAGTSGSGIWAMGDRLRLVALQTGFYKNSRVIKSTRWSKIMDLFNSVENLA